MDNDESKPAPAVVPARPKVIYRFACGAGPCTVMRIIDGESRRLDDERTKLPAPGEDRKG